MIKTVDTVTLMNVIKSAKMSTWSTVNGHLVGGQDVQLVLKSVAQLRGLVLLGLVQVDLSQVQSSWGDKSNYYENTDCF